MREIALSFEGLESWKMREFLYFHMTKRRFTRIARIPFLAAPLNKEDHRDLAKENRRKGDQQFLDAFGRAGIQRPRKFRLTEPNRLL